MLYIPLDIEVNIMLLIKELRMEKKIIFVPFMEGKSFRLVKYRLPLKNKQFGVREPKSSKVYKRIKIDLSIVPIIATDSSLRRVGFGKGMYDRFFEIYKKDIKRTIFVMRSLCFSKEIITNNYDIKGDILITKEGIKKRKYNKKLRV
jgi:5-formyltetrahydrofolate cyclo-ligase